MFWGGVVGGDIYFFRALLKMKTDNYNQVQELDDALVN